MNLAQCLQPCTWQHLWAIACGRELALPRRPTRADLRALLQADLGRPEALAAELATLPPEAHSALQILAYHGNWLPATAFCQRFGPLRQAHRGRQDANTPPWREPASITEQLYYRGLLYPRRRPRRRREQEAAGFTLPDEIIPLLPPAPTFCQSLPAPATLPAPPLLFNLAVFLAYLSSRTCIPRQGRWLAPRDFRPLLDRLLPAGCAWIAADRQGRGATSTRILRALHFLAEAAGFLPTPPRPARRYQLTPGRPARGEGHLPHPSRSDERASAKILLPTLTWHDWLTRPPVAQWAALRRALLMQSYEQEERWRAYRFPGWRDARPLVPFHRLITALRECPLDGTWLDIDSFLAGLSWRFIDLCPAPPTGDDPHRNLLTNLLAWLGLVQLDHPHTPAAFRLTPAGAALLQGTDDSAEMKEAAPFRLTAPSAEEINLEVHPACPPALLYPLAATPAVTWPVPGQAQLTPATLAGTPALALADLARLLDAGLAEPLPADLLQRLQRWAHEGQALRLRPVLLLESDDPELLAHLAGRRGLRRHIRRTLSRRAVEVDTHTADSLLRKLRRLGLAPIWPSSGQPRARSSPSPGLTGGQQGGKSEEERTYLLLTAQLYNRLPAPLRATAAIPQAVLNRLAVNLDPLAVELAEELAIETLDRFLAAIDSHLLPAPPTRLSPQVQERTLEAIHQALAEERPLEMAYYTAGRNELTHRTVEPLRLEERGGVLYLVAYCRLRREERLFRVDRIQEVWWKSGG